MQRRWFGAALLAGAVISVLTGCAADSRPRGETETLTVYTALPEQEAAFYLERFEAATGIRCSYIRLSAGEMLARVEAERENPQASVMLGGSTDNYIAAAEKGLLEPYQSPELEHTPRKYWDPEGVWNPIYVGCVAFACNEAWFTRQGLDYPTSWDDLLSPDLRGEIIMAHPATSGTAYTVLATLVQLMGEPEVWDYLKQLDRNMFQYTKSGSGAPNAVAIGEAAVALTFSHDGLQPTTEGYPVTLSFPEDGTGYEVGAAALIRGGAQEEAENARIFLDWICSAEGQSCYGDSDSFRVPLNQAATVREGLVTLDQVQVIDYDAVWAAGVREEYCARFEDEIISAPDE